MVSEVPKQVVSEENNDKNYEVNKLTFECEKHCEKNVYVCLYRVVTEKKINKLTY